MWAYIWLLVILKFNTENLVDSWEAIMTLLQFPILVWFAYCLDVKWKIPCFSRNSVEPLVEEGHHAKKHNYLEYRRNAMKGLGGGMPSQSAARHCFRVVLILRELQELFRASRLCLWTVGPVVRIYVFCRLSAR